MNINRRNFLKLSGSGATASLAAPLAVFGFAYKNKNEEGNGDSIQQASTRKAPVIIIRTSWGDTNIGDQGHTPGLINLLKKNVPGVEIVLWHTGKLVPETEKVVAFYYPDVKIIHGKFYDGDKPFEGEVHDAFMRADMYIFNSGMAMNFGLYNNDWPASMAGLTPFVWCKEHGIPFGIYGQSFDKFDHPAVEIFRNVLSQAAFVYCRDTLSLKFLEENKFYPPVLAFGPDAVFGITVRNEEKGLAYMKATGLEEKKFLVVIPLTNTPPRNGIETRLSPAKPTPAQEQQNIDRRAKMRELITQWVEQTDLKVLLCPEQDKEISYAKEFIYDKLPPAIQTKVVCREDFWNVSEAMSIFARAHTIFGIEPHSLIMGITMNVPIIHAWPASHGRKYAMFSDIGLGEWLFPVEDSTAAQWVAAIMDIYKNYPAAQQKVKKAMAFVRQRQAATMVVINKALVQKQAYNKS